MKVSVIESAYDCGALDQRMGAGPPHLVRSGLIEDLESAGHDVEHTRLDLGPGLHPEVGAAVELMRRIAEVTAAAIERGRFPVVLSGNCNAALGAVTGIGSEGTAVLWFDAHGDLNTPETSASGFFDGQGYAMLQGHGWSSLAATIPGFAPVPGPLAALAAARDLDPPEIEHLESWAMPCFPMAGLRAATGPEALESFAARGQRLYVHVDLDALDPSVLVANHLVVPGGLRTDELGAAIAAAGRGAPIAGIGFASYAPESDRADAGPGIVSEILGGVVASLDPK